MKHFRAGLIWRISLALPLALISVAPARGAKPGPMTLSEDMSLGHIHAALQAHRPVATNVPQRRTIFTAMDKHVTIRVRRSAGFGDEQRQKLKPLIEFYRRRVDVGLDKLAKVKVTRGVHAFKFYSSSYVLRSKDGTVLVDFAQGPIMGTDGHPEDADPLRCGFHWTPAQRRRLARQVDVSLITHRHFDHRDYSLSKLLLDAGKPVIAPAQVKREWAQVLPGVTVPDYGKARKFGPVEILTKKGWQYSTNRVCEDGKRRAFPNTIRPANDSETVIYLFRLGGLVFLHAGENHVPYGDFLRRSARKGWKVNVCLGRGQWQGAWSTLGVIRRAFHLSCHEYEMTHPGGGQRMAYRLAGGRGGQVRNGQRMVLFWGEDFLLTKELLKWAY
ncbi:MAG: MBL fold metallo-hydrolase [Planctomycetota bacterium]